LSTDFCKTMSYIIWIS